ncbi:hypothetical protein Daus18300_008026 [Diaporthe australafricana]|uniref:Protein kinase domain-containing protein n=1 Tax=Diaporthe australafricana TaxID=127596 RepID=A0ABR3WK80_9PEZI
MAGNAGTHAPEQFTETWNAFTDAEMMFAQDDTAGRYGWWTNLYQIGTIMTMLITQNIYDRPPIGTTRTISGLQPNDFDVFTYGGQVMDSDYDHYNLELRMTIAWVMARVPGQRPSMLQLQDILMGAVRRDYGEQGRTSIADILHGPPPPP